MFKPTFIILMLSSLMSSAMPPQSVLTDHDYMRAEQYLPGNVAPYVDRASVRASWINDHVFWYRVLTEKGSEFVLVDAAKGKRELAFDHEQLAAALSQKTGKSFSASTLPFKQLTFSKDLLVLSFYYDDTSWHYDLKKQVLSCSAVHPSAAAVNPAIKKEPGVLSPDKTKEAFLRADNLWIRSLVDGSERQLTKDGEKDFGYGTDNAGWVHSDRVILKWSPDSKKIATYKQDQRNVGSMYLIPTTVGTPQLESWKYELPGDTAIFEIHRCIVDVATGRVVMLQIPADPRRSTLSDNISSGSTLCDTYWSKDGKKLAFVSTSRDHKIEKVRMADAESGTVREVFQEKVATQFESGWDAVNWRYLSDSDEILWFSERDNYGHFYLYDAHTGKLKHQVTKGEYVVTELLKVDTEKKTLYFMACGLQKENPYYAVLCSIKMDGTNFTVLTPELGNHSIQWSPDKNYYIDAYSQPDVAPITVARALASKKVTQLEKASVERLKAHGWQPPHPICVKAADGITDLYGLLYLPSHLDSNKKYPIIDYIYPGPQGGSIGSWSFAPARNDNQALAELGFIVLQLEGSSNPLRSKSFHDMSYGHMATNTLPDQIAAIRQLASQRSYIDTSRVGIWGHSGGGFATAAAMFKYPDFFKVGISESGNHDNRNYEADWGERYNGLAENVDYSAQANQNYASQLKGKLLLIHGLMDDNVPASNTMLVVKALQDAGKDFDLIVLPNSRHGYGQYTYYIMRRRWDYFVKNLLGATTPKEYRIKIAADPRN